MTPRLYATVRAATVLVLRTWFRLRVTGSENVPLEGPGILTPNHKNFLDPFFLGVAIRRPLRHMAKFELFTGPLGWLFRGLGAFPVRRGEADTRAMETAVALLHRGELVVVFPEGTRVTAPDVLGAPHHGAARLAVLSGAPILPVAITGTSHLWRGALPRIKRVQVTFLPAIRPSPSNEPAPSDPRNLIDRQAWPAVREEYGRLRATPGAVASALAAVGVGGGLLARRQLRSRRQPRQLGTVPPRNQRRHP